MDGQNRSMARRRLLGLTPAPSAKLKSRERMCLAPQSVCHAERLNADLSPPRCFVPTSMHFAMVATAQWDRELITHPSSKCSALCKSQVMGIGRTPAANQARLSRDEFRMLSIADSTRLRTGRTAFFDLLDSGSSGRIRSFPLKRRCEPAY